MENIVNQLCELINISSYNTENNEEIIKYLINKFQENSVEIKKIPCGNNKNKNNLIIGINTKLNDIDNAIVLSAHIDTVLPNNNIKAVIRDNKIYGLGSCDMKCFVATILDNIEYLKNYILPVIVALTADEETTFLGIKDIINYFTKNNIKTKFVMLGEPTDLKLVVGNKGGFDYNIKVQGEAVHSSKPHLGKNAIYAASELSLFVEKLYKRYKKNNITMNVGKINGGKQSNIVAESCELTFDLRLFSKKIKEKIINKINNKICNIQRKRKLQIELKEAISIPPFEYKKSNLIDKIKNQISLPIEVVSYCTEAGFYQTYGANVLIFGCGDISVAHSENEHVEIDNLVEFNKYFIDILDTFINKKG